MRKSIIVAILIIASYLAVWYVGTTLVRAENGEPSALLAKVDEFDRVEIQRYHDIIVEAVKRRDLLIETAAKRNKVDLGKASYDIIAGEFRTKALEDKADDK